MELNPTDSFRQKLLKRLFSETVVLAIIVLNTAALVLDGFPNIHAHYGELLHTFDLACLIYYVLEVFAKVGIMSWPSYIKDNWNKFDFSIVLLGIPALIDPIFPGEFRGAEAILFLRMGRFLRFFRMLRFIPNVSHIWNGILRSLKASVGIFLVLFILNLITAMGANGLFAKYAPEYFGDPYISFYSMFKVFTIEGWYEIPDELALNEEITPGMLVFIRSYFALSVIIGGVLGLSLANAVFVDEMTLDNNDELEQLVLDMRKEIADYKQHVVDLQMEHQKRIEELLQPPGSRPQAPGT